MAATVDVEKCTGCGECVEVCPVEGITLKDGKAIVDEEACIDCGVCAEACLQEAVAVAV